MADIKHYRRLKRMFIMYIHNVCVNVYCHSNVINNRCVCIFGSFRQPGIYGIYYSVFPYFIFLWVQCAHHWYPVFLRISIIGPLVASYRLFSLYARLAFIHRLVQLRTLSILSGWNNHCSPFS